MAVKAATGKAAAASSEGSVEARGAIGDVVDVVGAGPEDPQAASTSTSVNAAFRNLAIIRPPSSDRRGAAV